MYVDRLELFVVYTTAVTTKRENARANSDRCVVDPPRTTVRVNRPIHPIVELMESVDTPPDEFEETYEREALVSQTPNSYRFKLLHSFFLKKFF